MASFTQRSSSEYKFTFFCPPVAPAFGFTQTAFAGSEQAGQVVVTIGVTNGVALTQQFTVQLTSTIDNSLPVNGRASFGK